MEKKCKNKKCQRILPDGYKYKYCENYRNEQTQNVKKLGKGALSVVTVVGGVLITVATRGKINPNSKS